jgi:hypothetical protein
MRWLSRSFALTSSIALLACSEGTQTPEPRWLERDPLAALPTRLSDVGVYAGNKVDEPLAPARAYEPGYPLWSDGGQKFRSIALPKDQTIDATLPDRYEFPVGTLIFKTFAYRTPASPERPVPVETRLLRLNDDGWELAAYAWGEGAEDAELLDLKRAQSRTVLSETSGEPFEHSIPSRLECRQCHESSASAVLGVSELQLARSGSLRDLTDALAPPPSEPYRALPEHGPLTTDVLGYLVGNCTHCHNGSNGAASSFDLGPEVALENLIDRPTESSATAPGIRVVPGDPENSVLYGALLGGDDALEVKAMPPLGVAERDRDAVELISNWISALKDDVDP